jgi:hypothetical protein
MQIGKPEQEVSTVAAEGVNGFIGCVITELFSTQAFLTSHPSAARSRQRSLQFNRVHAIDSFHII